MRPFSTMLQIGLGMETRVCLAQWTSSVRGPVLPGGRAALQRRARQAHHLRKLPVSGMLQLQADNGTEESEEVWRAHGLVQRQHVGLFHAAHGGAPGALDRAGRGDALLHCNDGLLRGGEFSGQLHIKQ